jgi:hypothetical protein
LNTSSNCYTNVSTRVTVRRMTHFDARVDRPEADLPPVPIAFQDDDVPARRLLAHDMESLVWDDDGERPLPPPD